MSAMHPTSEQGRTAPSASSRLAQRPHPAFTATVGPPCLPGPAPDGTLLTWILKSELGLRPIFHRTHKRSDGHLFITVIAYQLVQTIRRHLGEKGEKASWSSLRSILEGQQRVTATFHRKDGRTLHVRKATRAEPRQRKIYDALGLDPAPGSIKKMIV